MSQKAKGECKLLINFKNFLQKFENETKSMNRRSSTELKNCVTRTSNETYPVTMDELHAEVKIAIWHHMQILGVPDDFRLSLLNKVMSEVEPECRNIKDPDSASSIMFQNSKTTEGDNENEDIDDSPKFDLLKLRKFVNKHVEDFLLKLTDNSEAPKLRSYAERFALCNGIKCECVLNLKKELPPYLDGRLKNKPRKMEDRHVCLPKFGSMYGLPSEILAFYGVFDGHSGSLAANYSANQLPNLLAMRLKEKDNKSLNVAAYREALEWSFLQADKLFTQKTLTSGTTAICALLTEDQTEPTQSTSKAKEPRKHLYVAWVGDSKGLLVSPTASLKLINPHRPDTKDERKRIEKSGGGGSVMFVQGHWRVNGVLNVSRSIGDYSLPSVIAEPDFIDVEIHSCHDLIILGTDGLWDYVPASSIVNAVYESIILDGLEFEDIPKILIELAKEGESPDNISVVIIFLKKRQDIINHYEEAMKNFTV